MHPYTRESPRVSHPFQVQFSFLTTNAEKTSKKLWGGFSSFWASYKLFQKKFKNTFALYLRIKKKAATFALPIGDNGTENAQRNEFWKMQSNVLWHDEESNKIVRLRR